MIVDATVFTLLCAALFLLPMLPALVEWHRKRDAEPLKVVREYDGNIQHFANGFRHFLTQRFGAWIDGAPAAPPDPATVLVAGDDGTVHCSAAELASGACARLVLARGVLALGDAMFYEKELYGGAHLSSGERNSFRAILACGDIVLGADCSVLRWAHSDASVVAGPRARLYGRVSAAVQICLQRGSRFGRMSAPQIRFGPPPAASVQPQRPRQPLALPVDTLDQSAHRWLVKGDLSIPADTSHRGDLVARKHVRVGDHATILGNIKSNGDMVIGDDVHIDGALVATGKLRIGLRCMIKGPVVCDGQVVLCHGTVIGRADLPTTVTAAEIRVEEGVLAHGTVWAREVGLVAGPRA